ncbi:MAG: hypothetical protein P8129_00365 [Anaerolineae bacterium]
MTDEILGTFFGDETFPVEWESEEEKSLFWFYDDNHCPRPISPMYWSLNGWWGPTLDYMYRRFGFPLGKAWIGKRVNGYLYSAIVPREAESAAMLGPYYGWIMPTYASKFLDWWNDRYLPEIRRNFEYLDTFPTQDASLQELMVFLEEAIDIQERHFRLHWILNLAQFQSSMDLQAAVGEVVGEVDPALVGRILISIKDRNWDSLEALWKLKEKVKADPELKAIFDAGDTAMEIIPHLKASEKGQAFMADVEAYNKEYGVKASMYPHEYVNKLWVEDPAPAVESIKGYLAADYDFPTEYQKMVDDHYAAIDELKGLVPDTATPEQQAKLNTAIELATEGPRGHHVPRVRPVARLRRQPRRLRWPGGHQRGPQGLRQGAPRSPTKLGRHRDPLGDVRRALSYPVGLATTLGAGAGRRTCHRGCGQGLAGGSGHHRRPGVRGHRAGRFRKSQERRHPGVHHDQPGLGSAL